MPRGGRDLPHDVAVPPFAFHAFWPEGELDARQLMAGATLRPARPRAGPAGPQPGPRGAASPSTLAPKYLGEREGQRPSLRRGGRRRRALSLPPSRARGACGPPRAFSGRANSSGAISRTSVITFVVDAARRRRRRGAWPPLTRRRGRPRTKQLRVLPARSRRRPASTERSETSRPPASKPPKAASISVALRIVHEEVPGRSLGRPRLPRPRAAAW